MAGLAKSFGSGAMTNSINEIEGADAIFVTGSNTTEAHPVIALRVKKAQKEGAKLVVADPRKIDLVKYADLWLQHKPGTDVALLNGLMHVIIKDGLLDEEYIEDRTENFEAVEDIVEKYTPEYVSDITGVPAEDIVKAAHMYGEVERASILYAMGITQHTSGTDNVLSVACLAMLTGNVGKESTGVNPLRGQNNVQGACDLGALPNVYPGYQSVADPSINKKFEEAWGVELSDEVGYTVTEIFDAIDEDKVKALYVMGENPVLSDPDSNHIKEALEDVEFLVVQDIFMSETAEYADVVLPAASFAEKDGTFTNSERKVQRIRKAIEPIGESKPDWVIFNELAKRMGHDWDYKNSSQIMDEIASVTPIYGGMSYDRIEEDGLQWPCPDYNHPGTKYLHEGEFARGLGQFNPAEYMPPQEQPDDDYPYVLTTGRRLFHFHTGTMSRHADALDEHYPEELMEVNLADAEKLNVKEGDKVEVTSRRGTVESKVTISERVPEGLVFMSFHFAESAANVLTNPALDPVAKIPEYKVCAINIEKVS
ncbi:formate dehydrogenase major subunit [Selenihalanaerobacter shriftii]|uniref:Formate dehydrogenase major subunit n=1 Tax=Selenihalanaerobacter shriftii TaxID=142842 RepID=A0A1T4NSN2_9FIRM|nr:formate dehydrogenase major subunit [Selenihalanaerobacter shriftii]